MANRGSAVATPTPDDSVLAGVCGQLAAEYQPAASPNGPPPGNQNSEAALFASLADADLQSRSQAAMKLLRHAPERAPATLESAIEVEGTLGDFRVLNDLEQISTDLVAPGAGAPPLAFAEADRVAAASAIGRIIEQDRSAPPGAPNGGTGGAISPDDLAAAVAALKLSGCVGQPITVRAASLEALGLTRDLDAKAYLDTTAANPGEDDPDKNLFLEVIAARSLTNLTWNNHVVTLGLQPKIDALFERAQTVEVAP